jgi:hypothetical protein
MDKHTRPYVCREPGCEKIRGFTYSGGLLRHQREVHNQHGGPKAPRFCPHQDCKRSTGQGFSRKENLNEHLRRVHRGAGIEDSTPPVPKSEPRPSPTVQNIILPSQRVISDSPAAKKRRRGEDQESSDLTQIIVELRDENKRLKQELAKKDEVIKNMREVLQLPSTTLSPTQFRR